MVPLPLIVAVTAAPARGAYPSPPVNPRETITPPLGISFWLTSDSEITTLLLPSVLIPENLILLTPGEGASVSIMLKLFDGLFSVVGVWNIPLMNTIPFPPVVPIPEVFTPLTVRVWVLSFPSNEEDTSS